MADDKPIFTKNYTAEFNTGEDTLKQLAQMEWNIDEMFRMVYNGGVQVNDIVGIKNLFHYIVYVYADRLWAVAWDINHDDFEAKEKELSELYNDWIQNHRDKVPTSLLQKLRNYKRWLYELKQKKLKMGVPTRVETTAKERMNKAAGV